MRLFILIGCFVMTLAAEQALCEGGLIRFDVEGWLVSPRAHAPDGSDASATLAGLLPFSGGDRFTGSFTYDLSVPDASSNPEIGNYSASLPADSIVWTIGSVSFRSVAGSHQVSVVNRAAVDSFTVQQDMVFAGSGLGTPYIPAGWTLTRSGPVSATTDFGVLFQDLTATALSDKTLPNTLTLTDFRNSNMLFIASGGTALDPITLTTPLGSGEFQDIILSGAIDRLTLAAIPEPTTFALLSMGGLTLAGYGLLRCRRRTCIAEPPTGQQPYNSESSLPSPPPE